MERSKYNKLPATSQITPSTTTFFLLLIPIVVALASASEFSAF